MGFIHHAVAAVMLATLMLFLEGRHVLEWLDGAMLRATSDATASQIRAADPGPQYRPSIVDIDGAAFRKVFGERSPLDRGRLQELLMRLPLDPGKVLALDIDLSPAIHEGVLAARPLDQLLDRLARSGLAIVLVLPDPSADNANLGWIRARCGAGIHFASAALTERMGAITRVSSNLPTLAAVTLELAAARKAAPERLQVSAPAHRPEGLADRLCRAASDADSEYSLFSAAAETGQHGAEPETRPLHPMAAAMRYLAPSLSDVVLRDGRASPGENASLGNVIFVGGSYDVHDTFRTVDGDMPGLYVHAASFTSLAMNTGQASHLQMFVADVVLGIILGVLFGGMWHYYSKVEENAAKGLTLSTRWTIKPVLVFERSRLCLLLCWAVPVLLALGFALAAHWLLAKGWWLNPGPIILGMFLHSMSLRHTHGEPDGDGPFLKRLTVAHPDTVLVQLPLIVVLLLLIYFSH